jgi:hypothetical protein
MTDAEEEEEERGVMLLGTCTYNFMGFFPLLPKF